MQKLPFCYLCGKPFEPGDKVNRDHLPPSSLFAQQDHDPPLILPTHAKCNQDQHVSDELLAQLMGILRNTPVNPRQRKIPAVFIPAKDRILPLCKGLNIQRFIARCVGGFHAALYNEWLPDDTENAIHPPMQGVQIDGKTGKPTDQLNALLARDGALEQHARFAAIIKGSRLAATTDKVVSRNSKCIYECVWDCLNGKLTCVFGLKIDDWQRFGEVLGYRPRGCVGMYRPKSGRPANATRATDLDFPFPNREELDPFGE